MLRRVPRSALLLVIVAIIGLAVYGYFSAPLPFGLSNVIRNPGGSAFAPAGSTLPAGSAARSPAGRALQLGIVSLTIDAMSRSQDLGQEARGGSQVSFLVVQMTIANGGPVGVVPKVTDFQLLDDRGRTYLADEEATRTSSLALKRRSPAGSTVPPGGRLVTAAAFDVPPDATGLVLRASLGYGEIELAR